MPLVRVEGNRLRYHLEFLIRHELQNRILGKIAQGSNRDFDYLLLECSEQLCFCVFIRNNAFMKEP